MRSRYRFIIDVIVIFTVALGLPVLLSGIDKDADKFSEEINDAYSVSTATSE